MRMLGSIWVILCIGSVIIAQRSANKNTADLSWMAGCWEMAVQERGLSITEMWMKPDGGTLLGVGRTVSEGKTVSYEFMRIAIIDNSAVLHVRPSGETSDTSFSSVKLLAGELTFENKENDFPQRIVYRRGKTADTMFARIEGDRSGAGRSMDFAFKRTTCE